MPQTFVKNQHRLADEQCKAGDEWVFGNRFGRPRCQQDTLRRYIKPAASHACLGKIGWHTFRHSYSTLLRGMRVDVKVQQELLRHSTVQSTMSVYTQAVSEQKRTANSAVVNLLFGKANVSVFLSNGSKKALTAAHLGFIQPHSNDCYCGA
jgi:integrase